MLELYRITLNGMFQKKWLNKHENSSTQYTNNPVNMTNDTRTNIHNIYKTLCHCTYTVLNSIHHRGGKETQREGLAYFTE